MELLDRMLWLAAHAAVTGQERALSDELAQVIGARATAAPLRRHGESLVVPLTQGTPQIAFIAQLDSLDTGQTKLTRAEDRLVGAGAVGTACGLAIALDLLERPPTTRAGVSLVLHARGELGFDFSELRLVFKQDPEIAKVDAAVVLAPTANRLALGSGGTTLATLGFTGRGAHSGMPASGPNAIHRFARVLDELARMQPIPHEVEGLTWLEFITATAAQGGRFGTLVPNQFEVTAHHAYSPDISSHDSQERFFQLVDRVGTVRFEQLSPPAAPNRTHPLIRAFTAAAGDEPIAHQPWSEVSRFAKQGIAALNFGPGDPKLWRTRDEAITLDALLRSRTIIERFLADLV